MKKKRWFVLLVVTAMAVAAVFVIGRMNTTTQNSNPVFENCNAKFKHDLPALRACLMTDCTSKYEILSPSWNACHDSIVLTIPQDLRYEIFKSDVPPPQTRGVFIECDQKYPKKDYLWALCADALLREKHSNYKGVSNDQ